MSALGVIALFAVALPNAVVLRPVLNMYSRPADVVSQALYGSYIGVLEQKAGRSRYRTADHYTGWAPLSGLQPRVPYAAKGRVAEVQSLFAHVYRESNVTRHAPLITVPFETKFEVIAEPAQQKWIQVRLPDDRSGWVQLGDVAFDA